MNDKGIISKRRGRPRKVAIPDDENNFALEKSEDDKECNFQRLKVR